MQEIRARGSKRGIQVVSSYQTITQAAATAGKASAQALSSMYGTRVYFSCNDADSALMASRDLGQQEIIEHVESISYGAGSLRDSVSISKQRVKVDLVMPEQITSLPPRHAYLRLAGNYPITKIEVPVCDLPIIAGGFVARDLAMPESCQQIIEGKCDKPQEDVAEKEKQYFTNILDANGESIAKR